MSSGPGIVLVGGYSGTRLTSAEVFSNSSSCSVGDLPTAISSSSLCHSFLCGGLGNDRSCLAMEDDGGFSALSVELVERRSGHLCWGLPSGEILLLGGFHSRRTVERVSADGSSSSEDITLPSDVQ